MNDTTDNGWYAVDLDGTLAEYHGWKGPTDIGAPIPAMVKRVKQWMAEGKEVRIMTARVSPIGGGDIGMARAAIHDWCLEHIGTVLFVTYKKDLHMYELWDDRAIQVRRNEGTPVTGPTGFALLVEDELKSARQKFGTHHSEHESYAILKEEVDELWDEIKKHKGSNPKGGGRGQRVLSEIVQVAAMAQRFAEDLGFCEHD